jgi:hypothetical protein
MKVSLIYFFMKKDYYIDSYIEAGGLYGEMWMGNGRSIIH